MLNLLQNIEPADITQFARSVPVPEEFLLTREIVPNVEIRNVRYRIKRTDRRTNVAQFRAYDTETPFGRREVEHSVLEGLLPPVGQKLRVGELETILLAIEHGADDQELVDAAYDDAERHILSIRSRMELAAGDLLADRQFELVDENRLTLDADFGVGLAAGFSPVAAVLWSDPAAPAIDDEQAWIRFLIRDGDGRPGDAMSSAEVINFLAKNNQYKQSFYGDLPAGGRPTLTPGQVAQVRATNRLPEIREYDTQVRVGGVSQRVTPENMFFLLPADKRNFAETQYGITAESILLSRTGPVRIDREDLPGVVITAAESDDPPSVTTRGNAVAMPVMYAPKAYLPARVLAA